MSSDHPEEGAQLGPFRIGRQLGVGGMGVVFQALDVQLNRQVALKIITPHIGDDPEFRARFTREAQAQASLDSPHVVQVYSFGEAEGRLYIASQLIPDGDLGAMLREHGCPPARIALNIIAQVADALVVAHEAGLVHRDIKPANVLLRRRDAELRAYLGDFGIARRITADANLTVAGGTVGTPSYMAPEVHLGASAGPQSDLYALGCLLWATLTGSAPYLGSTDFQVVKAHLEAPVPQLEPTGPLAEQTNRVLRAALAKRLEDRYPTASALRDDLLQVVRLPDDAVPLRPAGAPAPPGNAGAASSSTSSSTPQGLRIEGPRIPTPTPPGAPRPAAPPAPAFRTPPGPTPQFAHYDGPVSRHGGPAPRRRVRLWLAMALAAGVVGVGIGLAVHFLAGSDSSPGGSGGGSDAERDRRAVASLSTAFGAVAGASRGECIATKVVDQFGVDRLVGSGILNQDLEFVSQKQIDDDVELKTALATATFDCVSQDVP